MVQGLSSRTVGESSTPTYPRTTWIRSPQGTIEVVVVEGKRSSQQQLANCSVRLAAVQYLISHAGVQIRYLIRLKSSGRITSVKLTHEQLSDEKSFQNAMPPGFALIPTRNAFASLRHCLMQDVAYANHEAIVQRLGWLRWRGQPVFAHAGGLICSENPTPQSSENSCDGTSQTFDLQDIDEACSVVPILGAKDRTIAKVYPQVPVQLSRYRLPVPEAASEETEAMRSVLDLLSIGDPNVTYIVVSAVFFAAVRDPRFALFLHGETGSMKTAFALLALSFFLPGATEKDVASLLSTENGLRTRFAATGNVAVVVDDYVEKPGSIDGGSEARKADNILRPTLNGVSRDACTGDGTLRPKDRPRGLPILTGETLPTALTSLLERCVKVAIETDTFAASLTGSRPNRFDHFQGLARDGVFAKAMAGFIRWVATSFKRFQKFVDHPDHGLPPASLHLRQVDAAEDLLSGASLMLTYAREIGAINDEEFDEYAGNAREAVDGMIERAQLDALDDCSAEAFSHCLQAAMASKQCYIEIENIDDYVKDSNAIPVECLGYSVKEVRVPLDCSPPNNELQAAIGNSETPESQEVADYVTKTVYQPNGCKIGSMNFEVIDLIPIICIAVANKLAARAGMRCFPAPKTFGKELFGKGWIARNNKGRNTYKARYGSITVDVWRVHAFRLFEAPIPEGTFGVEMYRKMTVLERRMQSELRRKEFARQLREKLSRYMCDELLNPHLAEHDRRNMLYPDPIANDEPEPNRIVPPTPGLSNLPGYSEEDDDLSV